jgi:pimeloyl-ACP methyl ester carboxylesterase
MEYFREVDGLKFFVREEGHGSPLVLCHGWSLDHFTWAGVCDHFAKRHRVIVPEMRGHGQSGCAGQVPFRRLVRDLVELLEGLKLSEPPVLCGHSLGGDIVLEAALDFPDLPRAIVVADAPGPGNFFTGPLAWASLSATLLGLRTLGIDKCQRWVSPFFGRLFYGTSYRRQRPDALAAWRDRWAATNVIGILQALRAQAWRENIQPRLDRIAVPTLVITGQFDRLARVREAQQYASLIPGARLAVIDGAGHMSLEENPAAFCAAIEGFLDGLSGRATC